MRFWSFKKPVMVKDTSKYRAKNFGFSTFNGKGTVNTYVISKQESVMDFLNEIRYSNPFKHIIVILDNFSAHRTENVVITAEILYIEFVFLRPYSPQLSPIELIWKSIKKILSRTFMKDQEMMIDTVKTNFIKFSKSKSLCENWVEMVVY